MAALGRRHDITAVSLITPDLDAGVAHRAMLQYCREVRLIPARPWQGMGKRIEQLRALLSRRSFERRLFDLPALRRTLSELLTSRSFDVVNVEFPFLANQRLRVSPPGSPPPLRVLDEHNIEFHLAQQQAGAEQGLARRIHNAANWPKLRKEEVEAFRTFDGVTFCSAADELRARALVPTLRSAVVPNAVDVEEFRRAPHHPVPDGSTVMFFGALNYFPNVDGLLHLVREIWPLIERSHPQARLKIVGQHPPVEVLSLRGRRVEVTGRVEDLRPHLASSAVTIVPLRIGGGTRFKILEAMAMARPVVSTTIGAEGIDAQPGSDILLADNPREFAEAVGRVLDNPGLGEALGTRGRALVERRYSWEAAAQPLEHFLRELLATRRARTLGD